MAIIHLQVIFSKGKLTLALACWMKCKGALPNSKAAPNQGIQPLMHGGALG